MTPVTDTGGNKKGIGSAEDYFDRGMENLKAGRLMEAYICANEALAVDPTCRLATTLLNHALYTLHPKKRLIDNANRLYKESQTCGISSGRSLELLTQGMKWRHTMEILRGRIANCGMKESHDLVYVYASEALAMYGDGVSSWDASNSQNDALVKLGLPSQPTPILSLDDPTVPTRYHWSNWPRNLKLSYVAAIASTGYAMVSKADGSTLSPVVPLDQLAKFFNNHVDGAEALCLANNLDPQWEELLPRLLRDVRPERFHFDYILLDGFFRHLPWPTIKQIFNSEQMMRAKRFRFDSLQLPCGVNPNAFFKELGAIRECEQLLVYPVEPGRAVVNMPRFSNVALLEWFKLKEGKVLQDGTEVKLFDENLTEGVGSLVTALMKDFASRRTRGHGYYFSIGCPNTNARVVHEMTVTNRATRETLDIKVVEDRDINVLEGRPFNSVIVRCVPPGDDGKPGVAPCCHDAAAFLAG